MTTRQSISRLKVFPLTAGTNENNHLVIGGCDSVSLAEEFGTPLCVFDEADIRSQCTAFKQEFSRCYPDTIVCYSAKAFTTRAMLKLVKEEGLDLDVVTGGELEIARSVEFPMGRIHFPGNNKSAEELEIAVSSGIGHIVVDNLHELGMLIDIAGGRRVNILLRLTPGIDLHTHKYNTTGTADSKFGLPRDRWDEAVATVLGNPNLNFDGLHFHLGSGIFEMEPYLKAIEVTLEYAAVIQKRNSFEIRSLSIGGGFGVGYTVDDSPPTISAWAETTSNEILNRCRDYGINPPQLIIEPGRAIVGRAGITLYRVGVIKDIPGIRRFVCVDGGMGDNIRPPMYGAHLEALVANRMSAVETNKVTIAGKYCESGDILIRDINMPDIAAGDILAVAGSGAYAIPLQSNYNSTFRPAIVFVRDGKPRLVRRRETLEDLINRDVI